MLRGTEFVTAETIIATAKITQVKLRPARHIYDGTHACAGGMAAIVADPSLLMKDPMTIETAEKTLGKDVFVGLSGGFENPEISQYEYPKKQRPWVLIGRDVRDAVENGRA